MLLLGGCASNGEFRFPSIGTGTQSETSPMPHSEAAPVDAPIRTQAQRKLAEGIALYEQGKYATAIHALHSPEIGKADTATRVQAQKYLAFSYCVTQRRKLCRRAFDELLRIDEDYELEPAESGHPLWGPVFVQARKAAERRSN